MKKALLLTIISLAPLAQAETQNEIPLLPTNVPAIPVSDAQSCVAISDPATRLACYDRAYTAPNQAEPKSIDIAQSHAASKAAQSPQIVCAEPSDGEIYSPLTQQYDLDNTN